MFGNETVMKVMAVLSWSIILGVFLYYLVSSHIWPMLVKAWSKRFGKETEEKIKG